MQLGLRYTLGLIVVLTPVRIAAQADSVSHQVVMSGLVTDPSNNPLPNARIEEIGRGSVTTNASGRYSIVVRTDRVAWLRVSALGFQSATGVAKDGQQWRLASLENRLRKVAVKGRRIIPMSEIDNPTPRRIGETSSVGFGAVAASDQGSISSGAAAINGVLVDPNAGVEGARVFAVSRSSASTTTQFNGARIYTDLVPADLPVTQRISLFSTDVATSGHGSGVVELLVPNPKPTPAALLHVIGRQPAKAGPTHDFTSARGGHFDGAYGVGGWLSSGKKGKGLVGELAVTHLETHDRTLQEEPTSLSPQALLAVGEQLHEANRRQPGTVSSSVFARASAGEPDKSRGTFSLLAARRRQRLSVSPAVGSFAIGGDRLDAHVLGQITGTMVTTRGDRITTVVTGGEDQWSSLRSASDSVFIVAINETDDRQSLAPLALAGPSIAGASQQTIRFAQADLRGVRITDDSANAFRLRATARRESAFGRVFQNSPMLVVPEAYGQIGTANISTIMPGPPSHALVTQIAIGTSVERRIGPGITVDAISSVTLADRSLRDSRVFDQTQRQPQLGFGLSARFEGFGDRILLPGQPRQPRVVATAGLGRFTFTSSALDFLSTAGNLVHCASSTDIPIRSSVTGRPGCIAWGSNRPVGLDRSNAGLFTVSDKANLTLVYANTGPWSASFRALAIRESGIGGISLATNPSLPSPVDSPVGGVRPDALAQLRPSRDLKVFQLSTGGSYRLSPSGSVSFEILQRNALVRGWSIAESATESCCSWSREPNSSHTFFQLTGAFPVANTIAVFTNLQVRSGIRWTPIAGHDKNGDGFLNDSPSTELTEQDRRELVRRCGVEIIDLPSTLLACRGPWSGRLALQFGLNPERTRLPKRLFLSFGINNALPILSSRLNDAYGTDRYLDRRASVAALDEKTGQTLMVRNPRFGRLIGAPARPISQVGVVLEGRWTLGPSASDVTIHRLQEAIPRSSVEREARVRSQLVTSATNIAGVIRSLPALTLSDSQLVRLQLIGSEFNRDLSSHADTFLACWRRGQHTQRSARDCYAQHERRIVVALTRSSRQTRGVLTESQRNRLPWVLAILLDERTLRAVLPRSGRSFIASVFN